MFEAFIYHPEKGLQADATAQQVAEALKDPRALMWLDLTDLDDADVDLLTTVFNLHPLTVEDLIMPNARTKVEKFTDYMFLVMFALEPHGAGQRGKVKTLELDCCLGRNYLITCHTQPVMPLSVCKERVKKQSPVLLQGADMLLYSILDSCVDSYFPVISDFDNLVDEMSDELFRDPTQETLKKIYHLKNDVLSLRRTIGPQADVISLIQRGDFELISPSNTIYFRNIYDNLIRLNDIVGTSREIITGAMEAYVSVVSNRLNEIMKTLTVITTIMMPLTLIASIYGMNFKHMPELDHPLGYYSVLGFMVLVGILMVAYFKRKSWF
ncbi:MAG: magnesium/cobalt transporter CorA [Candidatus Omnitrophica bacterium]|nr:magnesium/cobalt transporter CorA [Candidatus Omnitrophota bacterium]MDD5575184.1 magnesium/cobalt transporter CorA [Candidatus Omnitrophota bacterium]